MASVACIVLAAGGSTRFGADKMLQTMPGGTSIVESTVSQYLKVFEQVTVVVKSAATHPLYGHPRLNLVAAGSSALKLSNSIKVGLMENQANDGWLIALGDMPYIKSTTISQLKGSLTRGNIVVPMLQGRQGNPVGFGSAFTDSLMGLQGDTGAKSLIQKHADCVISLETQDRGVVLDIDRPIDIL